jgi:hypothetical protein
MSRTIEVPEGLIFTIFGIWNDEDDRPDLIQLHLTLDRAEAERDLLNGPYRQQCVAAGVDPAAIPSDWPHLIKEHEAFL